MANLSKWFPFKFKRATNAEQTAPATTTTSSPAPASPREGWPMLPMQQVMQRMMSDDFWRDPFAALGHTDRFFGDFAPSRFQPTVDVVDEGKFVKVSAELPGIDKDDLKLQVDETGLTLSGEKRHESKQEEEGCYRTERFYGSFQRHVPLPLDVDTGRAEAQFDKGVLTVRFPKTAEKAGAKKIEVK